MFLQDKRTGNLVEILDIKELLNPTQSNINGQFQAGEEEQDPEQFAKEGLLFPSGEELPRCWMDANYQKSSN
ncbi:MAG: acetyltransferase [Scytonematopsis contorta HA4267-MV1]|nr:acetyltransferase [Scytonematopsis contorta HA4267-MV1]